MKKIIFFIAFVFFGCTTDKQAPVGYVPVEVFYANDAKTFETLLNEIRVNNNVSKLIPERNLTAFAIQKAYDMYVTHSLNHDGFYARYIASGSVSFGECVAFDFITPASEISAYENSPSHFLALVNPNYKYFGYGKIGQYQCVELASYNNNGHRQRNTIIYSGQNISLALKN